MISMDKTYRRQDKADAVVKFTDGPPECPVGVITCGYLLAYGHDGLPMNCAGVFDKSPHPMRLIEVSPYADFKIDEPVMVRDSNCQEWIRRLFSGVRESNGFAEADFRPAWVRKTSIGCAWTQCRRPTAEELAS